MDNKTLTIVYTFFLGLIVALFVGLGISTFYPGPKMPDFPDQVYTHADKEPSAAQIKAQEDYNTQFKQYNQDSQVYSRNVSMITLVSAVLVLVLSFIFERRNQVIANGLLLGGVFTLLYSITRGFVSEDTKYTFVAVTVGLLVALYLGYRRFSEASNSKKKSKKRR